MAKQSKAALALKRLRERAGYTVREVADFLGKAPSTYSFYEDKFKGQFIPIEISKKLRKPFEAKGIDYSELLALAGVADAFDPKANLEPPPAADIEDGMASIDELDATGNAGPGTNVSEVSVVRSWKMPRNVVSIATDAPMDRIKIVPIKGDSMVPTYNPVDRVMVDTQDTLPSPGGVFFVWDGLGLVVKRVEYVPHSDPPKVIISSDNPKYKPYERVLDEAFIQGRVIGKWLWT